MPKMTDQEFDNLFRQAANRISPEQQPGDWDDMQRSLEVAERDARARNISLYSMLVLLLLYSFVVPDSLKSGRSEQASVLPQVEEVEQAISTEGVSAENTSASGISAIEGGQPTSGTGSQDDGLSRSPVSGEVNAGMKADQDISTGQENSGATGVDNATVDKTTKDKGVEVGPADPQRLEGEAVIRHHRRDTQRLQKTAVATGAAIVLKDVSSDGNTKNARSVSPDSAGEEGIPGDEASNSSQRVVKSGTQTGLATAAPAELNPVQQGQAQGLMHSGETISATAFRESSPSTAPLFADPVLRAPRVALKPPGVVVAGSEPATRHPLFVRLAISPDFSSIDYGSAGKTGLNFGPMFEYGLSPRFALSTGAIWSKKLYDQENPGKSYGSTGYPTYASMLNGDCRILDIPLNLTYYMFPGRKTNLFITVGSSSYIMLDEEYVYTVRHNNKDYEYVETYSNKNNEWFSMLNVSFGVQHQVSKRWFVQGEPFLKAPMKGVGEGKVNLVSAGVFVSVKYWINP